jgi:hypothetical protein
VEEIVLLVAAIAAEIEAEIEVAAAVPAAVVEDVVAVAAVAAAAVAADMAVATADTVAVAAGTKAPSSRICTDFHGSTNKQRVATLCCSSFSFLRMISTQNVLNTCQEIPPCSLRSRVGMTLGREINAQTSLRRTPQMFTAIHVAEQKRFLTAWSRYT